AGTARSWYTITLGSTLPSITSPVVLDATTQPLSVSGTGPVVELNAAAAAQGIDLQAGSSGSTIRGFVINRSPGDGVRVGSSNNVVAGSFLGTNVAGPSTAGLGNQLGVDIVGGGASNNLVGGTTAADRNVISGSAYNGIEINAAANNLVQGNYVGVDVTGTVGLGNANDGVRIFAGSTGNTIGGTAAGAGNVVSANGQRGIEIYDLGTNGNAVQGNRVGTNAAGTAGIPNNLVGVSMAWGARNNTIGGTAANAGNLIAFNIGDGIHMVDNVNSTFSNAILGNAIHSNGAQGIDLADDGVTPNDAAPDADTGPNNLQNYPVLTAAMTNGAGSANFGGSLSGAASTAYRIEFFASAAADPSGFGEGQRYLGFTSVTTDAAGNAIIGVTLATALTAGEVVTA